MADGQELKIVVLIRSKTGPVHSYSQRTSCHFLGIKIHVDTRITALPTALFCSTVNYCDSKLIFNKNVIFE